MGSRGDCFDNAVAESFFATLKKELVNRRPWPQKAELRSEIFDYIEIFYNRQRRHSTLGMRSPGGLREQHSQRPREQTSPLRGSRPPTTIEIHCTNHRCPRLINPCPPKRGNSTDALACSLVPSIAITPTPTTGLRTKRQHLPEQLAQRPLVALPKGVRSWCDQGSGWAQITRGGDILDTLAARSVARTAPRARRNTKQHIYHHRR